jgi:hypothetical protein
MPFASTAGFATAGSITPEEYLHAKPDSLADFAGPVMKHMNEDHAKSIAEMVAHFTKIYCEAATMVEVDRRGFTVRLAFVMPPLLVACSGCGAYSRSLEDR